jgi:hypothetical protein
MVHSRRCRAAARTFSQYSAFCLGFSRAESRRGGEEALHLQLDRFHRPRHRRQFEKLTGIKVTYDVYDAEETMEARLLAGGSGYDLVSASTDYFSREIKAGVYETLDKSKLPN